MVRAGTAGAADPVRAGRRRGVPARLVAAAATGALVLFASGCARPAGVDGSLTNNWPPFPAASVPVPVAGTCYDVSVFNAYALQYPDSMNQVGCDNSHNAETVYVGTFTGADAARSDPPPRNGASGAAAFEQCGKAADGYLGGNWQDARVVLRYLPATPRQWQGGGRFYRCDLVAVQSPDGQVDRLAGSMHGVLAHPSALSYGCAVVEYAQGSTQEIDDLREAACGTPHDAEYAGFFTARATTYPSGKDMQSVGFAGCDPIVAGFLGMSISAMQARSDPLTDMYWATSRQDWEAGDRTIRCWALLDGKKVQGSIRGIGSRPLPY